MRDNGSLMYDKIIFEKKEKKSLINKIKAVDAGDPKEKMYDPWEGRKSPEFGHHFGYAAM